MTESHRREAAERIRRADEALARAEAAVRAATETAPTDFAGYLMVYVVDGPGIWRVVRDDEATCENCNATRESTGQPMYRTVALTHEYDPELGVCQGCVQRQWDRRLDDRADPDPSGDRPHMFKSRI